MKFPIFLASTIVGMAIFLSQGQNVNACPSGWKSASSKPSKCFYYSTELKTEADAKKACGHLGGHLASIENEDQQNVVVNLIKEKDTSDNSLALIGGSRNSGGDPWKWEDGTQFSYTKFGTLVDNPNSSRLGIYNVKNNPNQYNWLRYSDVTNPYPFVCSKIVNDGGTGRETGNDGGSGTCPGKETGNENKCSNCNNNCGCNCNSCGCC